MAKVFYAYTPHPDEQMKAFGYVERATVAARLVDGKLEYGVTICRGDDNFSRAEGKKRSLEALEENFGSTNFNEHYQQIAQFYSEESEGLNDGTERATIQFVNDLAKSVWKKMDKYKKKVGQHNKKLGKVNK